MNCALSRQEAEASNQEDRVKSWHKIEQDDRTSYSNRIGKEFKRVATIERAKIQNESKIRNEQIFQMNRVH